MHIRVKICGLTHPEDVQAAIAAGADAVGFVFVPSSKRHVSLEAAATLARLVPPFVAKVGLFVNGDAATVADAIRLCRLDTVQLHGDEEPAFCARFHDSVRVIKGLRLVDEPSLWAQLGRFEVDAYLLDAHVAGQHGGTGTRCDWTIAQRAVAAGHRIVLAGGLDPSNVAEAVRSVRPFAVDVSSGVESAPGRKDPARMSAFVNAAKMTGGNLGAP